MIRTVLPLIAFTFLSSLAVAQAPDESCPPPEDFEEPLSPEDLANLGEEYGPLIGELQSADAAADAHREAKAGDFRLLRFFEHYNWNSESGTICAFDLPDELIRGGMSFSDVISGTGETVYRVFVRHYIACYNRTMAGQKGFPYPDICRARRDGDSSNHQTSMPLSEWRKRTVLLKDPQTLHEAARAGDRHALRRLLKSKAQINELGPWGFTPLGWAALRGDEENVRLLLKAGADPAIRGPGKAYRYDKGTPAPLILAVYAHSASIVRLLVEAGADVNTQSTPFNDDHINQEMEIPFGIYGRGTALWIATASGQSEIVRYLIEQGADPDGSTGPGTTPIFAAVAAHRPQLASMLLEAGADPARRGIENLSILQWAAVYGDASTALQLVNRYGALAEARSQAERTLWKTAAEAKRGDMLMELVAYGAHVNLLTTEERSALEKTIAQGSVEDLRTPLDIADKRAAALEEAIRAGDITRVRSFYRNGAERAEGRMRTGLISAVAERRPEIAEWYIAEGADVDSRYFPDVLNRRADGPRVPEDPFRPLRGNNAVLLSFLLGPTESVKLTTAAARESYSNQPHDGTPLHSAFIGYRFHKDIAVVDAALEFSPLPKTGPRADRFLNQVCRWLERETSGEAVKHYLAMGFRPRQKSDPELELPASSLDGSALEACIRTNAGAALALIAAGADPNQGSSIASPVLMVTVLELIYDDTYVNVVEALLEAGADPNHPSGYGYIVLDYVQERIRLLEKRPEKAAVWRRAEELLLSYGAKTRAELEAEGRIEPLPERKWVPPIPVK